MRNLLRGALAASIVCLAAGTLSAAADPFLGKWKANASKSRLTDEMKVDSAGDNRYAITFGPDAVDTIVADGTDQPALLGSTLSITVEGPNQWKVVRKKDGHVQILAHWTLSADSKTLEDDYTQYSGDRPALKLHYLYHRTAGSSGFAGTWDAVSNEIGSIPGLEIQAFEGDGLSFGRYGMQMKFDGKDYPYAGKEMAGYTSSGRRVDQRKLEITDRFQGKVTSTRQIEISEDLKTLTMMIVQAGDKTPKNILVFDRE